MSVRSPATCAIMRWMCSNCTPPTSFGILYQEPKDVGQSGTDNPASLLVTSAPAMRRRKVQLARVTANLWCPWLYGLAMNFRTCSSDIPSGGSDTGGLRNGGTTPYLEMGFNQIASRSGREIAHIPPALNVWSTVL